MDKVAVYHGISQSHGFNVDIFRDSAAGVFVAQLQTYTPALIPQHIPGTPIPMMEFEEPEELRHENLNTLLDLTKQQITS